MLDGKREGWIEVSVIVDGNVIDSETHLVRATGLRELATLRRVLIKQHGAKLTGRELADGDIIVDFHRDERGEDGGIESYVLDPVAFAPGDAIEVLPAVLDLPKENLLMLVISAGHPTM